MSDTTTPKPTEYRIQATEAGGLALFGGPFLLAELAPNVAEQLARFILDRRMKHLTHIDTTNHLKADGARVLVMNKDIDKS